MKTKSCVCPLRSFGFAALILLGTAVRLYGHCDSLDGPVVKAGQLALDGSNVNLALIWVQKDDEAEIKRVFDQTVTVRKLGPAAKELADRYFFETLVRLHRAGEGAPYTGLKPAGRDLGPAILAGDEALATGKIGPVLQLLSDALTHGLQERFQAVQAKRNFAASDVAAGRDFVKAYVSFIHFVEAMHEVANASVHDHPAADSGHNASAAAAHAQRVISEDR